MRNTLMIGLAAISLLGAQPCLAGYMASLSTTAPDLNNLTVGQKVTFDVNLSGIGSAADNLDFLAATVKFDGSLLGTSTITPGGIVPDLTGFQSTAKAGLADANYDSLFAASEADRQQRDLLLLRRDRPRHRLRAGFLRFRQRHAGHERTCPSRPAPRCRSAPAWSRNPHRGSSSGLGCWEPPGCAAHFAGPALNDPAVVLESLWPGPSSSQVCATIATGAGGKAWATHLQHG